MNLLHFLNEIRDLRSFFLGQNEHLQDDVGFGLGILGSCSKFNILTITARSFVNKVGICVLLTCHINTTQERTCTPNSDFT